MPQKSVKIRSIQYALTATLKPKWFTLEPKQQFDLLQNELYNIFKNGKSDEDYRLTMKAEYTKSYNIHAHGVIDILMRSANDNPKLIIANMTRKSKIIGFICIKAIDNYHKWKEYIDKEHEVKDTLGYDILIDNLDLYQEPNQLQELLGERTNALNKCVSELTNNCCF